jgi:uncharacterized membrane protein
MKKLQTIYQAMLMAQVLFAGIAVFIRTQSPFQNVTEDTSRILQVVAIVFAFSSIWAGMSLYRKRIAALKEQPADATQKINGYTAASLIKWAMAEGPCLFCSVGYLLTGNWAFIMLAAVVLFVFAGYAPQKSKITAELGLTEQEAEKI